MKHSKSSLNYTASSTSTMHDQPAHRAASFVHESHGYSFLWNKQSKKSGVRIARVAVTAALVGILAYGSGAATMQATYAEGIKHGDNSYIYSNRDRATNAESYVTMNFVPVDKDGKGIDNNPDRASFGSYYTVEYTFNQDGEWWGGRPFWWGSLPKGVTIDGNIEFSRNDTPEQETASFEEWKGEKSSRFYFANDAAHKQQFNDNWTRMTGQDAYNNDGKTLDLSKEYAAQSQGLFINWEKRGKHKTQFKFRIKLEDKNTPLYFAAGVYQVMGNWHYTMGKTLLPVTLPSYADTDELAYPDKPRVIGEYGKPSAEEKKQITNDLWEKNKDNKDLLSHLKGKPTDENGFNAAVTINDDGSATVTYADDSKDTIHKANLTRRYTKLSDITKLKYPERTLVKNPTALSDSEKAEIEKKITAAQDEATKKLIEKVQVDKANGNATITFKDTYEPHSTKVLEGKFLIGKKHPLADDITPWYPPFITEVPDIDNVDETNRNKVRDAVFNANKTNKKFMDALKGTSDEDKKKNIVVGKDGAVTITYSDDEQGFESKDHMNRDLLVKKAPSMADTHTISIPARMGVKNATKLETTEKEGLVKLIKEKNQDIVKDLAAGADAIKVDENGTTTITYKDNSKHVIPGERLVYTVGNATTPTKSLKNLGNIKYFLTPMEIKDGTVASPQDSDWHRFINQFLKDNYQKNDGSELTDVDTKPFNNFTSSAISFDKVKDKWKTKDGTSGIALKSSDWRANVITQVLVNSDKKAEFSSAAGAVFTVDKTEAFYKNGGAFEPDKAKQEVDNALDKALKDKGFTGDELDKLKKELENDPDFKKDKEGIKNQSDVDKLLQKIDEHANNKKKKADKKKKIDAAADSLGLSGDDKEKFKKELENADPSEIDKKIAEKQQEHAKADDEKKEQEQKTEDQKQKDEISTQQQADDGKVDANVANEANTDGDDKKDAEKQKKEDELKKKKAAAKQELGTLDNLSPEDKANAQKAIDDAADESGVTDALNSAKEKNTANKTAQDAQDKQDLTNAKNAAKEKLKGLTKLTDAERNTYSGNIDGAGSVEDVWKEYDKAELENAKRDGKAKIEQLKKDGKLTENQAADYEKQINEAKSARAISDIVSDAETAAARTKAQQLLDNAQNLNNKQKAALQAKLDDAVINPADTTKDSPEKVNKLLEDLASEISTLDGAMGDLDNLVKLADKQNENNALTGKAGVDQAKKTAFETALKNGKDLLNKDAGDNDNATKVTEKITALKNALKDLGGDTVDKTALREALAAANKKVATPAYIEADKNKKDALTKAMAEGNKILQKKGATAEEIASATNSLNNAAQALNGAIKGPKDKIQVWDAASLTDAEVKAVQDGIIAANPNSKLAANNVVVEKKTDATAHKTAGTTTVKWGAKQADKAELSATDTIVEHTSANTTIKAPQEKFVVSSSELTVEQQAKLKDAIIKANADISLPAANVAVDKNGNVTITYKDGSKTELKADSLISVSRSEDFYALHAMYRLYNPYTHEHLFTTDAAEKDNLVALGWNFEGIPGKVYMHGEKGGVYRLYNPTTGEHHYTTKEDEVADCVKAGWKNEGVKFFSVLDKDKETVGMVSMYNPYETKFYHHYTSNADEIAKMVKDGWRKEEVKWYAAK